MGPRFETGRGDDVDELAAHLLRGLLDLDPCEECRGDRCEEPCGVTDRGRVAWSSVAERDDLVYRWQVCPGRLLQVLRASGHSALPISELLGWELDRGTHRRRLSAGGESLLLANRRLSRLPEPLRQVRDADEREASRKAKEALRSIR